MYDVGIKYISDLFNENNKVIPFQDQVNRGLPKIYWMKWRGLINTIKRNKVKLVRYMPSEVTFVVRNASIDEMEPKDIYNHNVCLKYGNDTFIPPISKMMNIYGEHDIQWDTVFVRIHKLLPDVKSKEFQYKFVNDALVNKYWLHKWKISENDLCRWCKSEQENIVHVFWECPIIRQFWDDFSKNFDKLLSNKIDLSLVLLGHDNELICQLIVIAKRFIYTNLYYENAPHFKQYLQKVFYIKKMEEHISKNNKQVDKWWKKWQSLL